MLKNAKKEFDVKRGRVVRKGHVRDTAKRLRGKCAKKSVRMKGIDNYGNSNNSGGDYGGGGVGDGIVIWWW